MTLTRFAPSPTGSLHVGNLRTALLNRLFARSRGGRFLLRLDDTDAARCEARFADGIREDLRWAGIAWDHEIAQSDRLRDYAAAADALRAAGRLYPCWETPEELALRRRARLSAGRPPVYDRAALALDAAGRAAMEAARGAPHWRFRLDDAAATWTDGVLGPQRVAAGAVSDPVLLRADGTPLYTLASVVDDAATGVTDVIRGADHVTNTAAQIAIFAALGASPPRFAHHSLLTGPGGAALSKRDGALSLADLRAEGVEPSALAALLARLGGGGDPTPVAALTDLVHGFDLSRFGAAPVVFDPDQLRRLSAQTLRGLDFAAVADRLAALGVDGLEAPALWAAVRPNVARLAEVADWAAIAARGADAPPAPEDADFVARALALLPPRPWDDATWGAWTRAVGAATGRRGAALFRPLRRALTGRDHGPDMAAFMPLLRRP
jgi:glutamyl-tRNA synthetase